MAGLIATAVTSLGGAAGIAKIASIGGTILSSVGAVQQGNAAQASANYQAAQLEQQGKTERALSSKKAAELERRKRVEQSDARATGAAFGGGVDYDVIGDLEEFGELDALTALWEGEEAAKGRNAQAAAARAEGRFQKRASRTKALSTLIDGGTSYYDKYGKV